MDFTDFLDSDDDKMENNEDAVRRKMQRNALEVYGARIDTTYLVRKSEVVGVTRNDLSDLIQFDGIELLLCTIGQFFLAGGLWLFIENWLSSDFAWDALTVFCLASAVFGGLLWFAGYKIRTLKQKKITIIFEETTPC